MPLELRVIRASEFVRLDASEHLDLEASKEALRALAQACHKRGLRCAMLDLRSLPVLVRPHFAKSELVALVGTFREAGFLRRQKLAILYSHDVHGGIRNFAFISRMRGLQVHAFGEFEGALHWLSTEPGKKAESGGAVPIRLSKPPSKSAATRSVRRM